MARTRLVDPEKSRIKGLRGGTGQRFGDFVQTTLLKTLEQETIKGARLVLGGEEGASSDCNDVTGLDADNRGACTAILRQPPTIRHFRRGSHRASV